MANIVVIGHSHMVAARDAYVREPHAYSNTYRFIQLRDDKFVEAIKANRMISALQDEIGLSKMDVLVSMLHGNEHAAFGTLNHPQKFDFVLPEKTDLPLQSDAEILPYSIIRNRLKELTIKTPITIRAFRASLSENIWHFESPPPKPEPVIRRHPGMFYTKIDELGVAPVALRYKLWRVSSSLYREACVEQGVNFMPSPASMADESGTMALTACAKDATHANEVYGREVLLAFESALRDSTLG